MTSLIAIVGPTATGKSSLAMELAQELGGEIVNADALQVYQGFDIGTAKPTQEERTAIPHHLVGFKSPQEPFSAGEFVRLARKALSEISERDRIPFVVGGSGLYLKALLEGIHEIPPVDCSVREELRSRFAAEGLEALRADLARLDPVTEARLASGDRQRILRALEVAISTGRPLSSWISSEPTENKGLEATKIGLTLPRPVLYDRIQDRVESMLRAGWLNEVESLKEQGFTGDEPAFQAIGYRQLWSHLQGLMTLSETAEAIAVATRRYAKRQITWFRNVEQIHWLDGSDRTTLVRQAKALCTR